MSALATLVTVLYKPFEHHQEENKVVAASNEPWAHPASEPAPVKADEIATQVATLGPEPLAF